MQSDNSDNKCYKSTQSKKVFKIKFKESFISYVFNSTITKAKINAKESYGNRRIMMS